MCSLVRDKRGPGEEPGPEDCGGAVWNVWGVSGVSDFHVWVWEF